MLCGEGRSAAISYFLGFGQRTSDRFVFKTSFVLQHAFNRTVGTHMSRFQGRNPGLPCSWNKNGTEDRDRYPRLRHPTAHPRRRLGPSPPYSRIAPASHPRGPVPRRRSSTPSLSTCAAQTTRFHTPARDRVHRWRRSQTPASPERILEGSRCPRSSRRKTPCLDRRKSRRKRRVPDSAPVGG